MYILHMDHIFIMYCSRCVLTCMYPICLPSAEWGPFVFSGTALCLVCACGDTAMTELLLSHGADVNHTSHHSSPLIYASEYNNVQLTALLLEHGASVKEVRLQDRVDVEEPKVGGQMSQCHFKAKCYSISLVCVWRHLLSKFSGYVRWKIVFYAKFDLMKFYEVF